MEVERCPNCGESKTVPANLFTGTDRPGASIYPAGMAGIFYSPHPGVAVVHAFHCCLCCGHLWSTLGPETLAAFVSVRGTKLGKQYLETVRKGPYHDIPDHPAARQAADATAEIDRLMVLGKDAAATRRYRDVSGKTWDQAIDDLRHWRSLERAEKLALFGWPPEEKHKDKDLEAQAHPMRDPWLDG